MSRHCSSVVELASLPSRMESRELASGPVPLFSGCLSKRTLVQHLRSVP